MWRCLACSANLPTADRVIYFTFRNFFFFNLSQIISGSTGPIFTIFSPNERCLLEFWSWPLFLIPQGTLPWQPIDTNASTSCENVVNIGSVTSEFKKGVCGIVAKTGQKYWMQIGISSQWYLSNCWTNLYRTFSIGSRIYRNYKTSISFAVAQGTLLAIVTD